MKDTITPTIDSRDIGKESYYALSLLMLLIVVLALSPMLNSGFISDDTWASCLSSSPNLRTMLAATYDQVLMAARLNGHLAVLFTLWINVVYTLSRHDPLLYKLIILGMILINVILFERFVYKISRSRMLSLLSIVSLPVLFQFRNYHDPRLSFAGSQQLTLITFLISLLFLNEYFDTGNITKYWLSVLFYFICLQIYEITYSFFVFYLLLAYLKTERKAFFKLSLPFVALPVSLTIVLVILKHIYPPTYTGTVPSYDVIRIFQTFFKQVFAAFPFSYVLFFFNKTISYDRSFIFHHYAPPLLLAASVSAVFAYYFLKTSSKINYGFSLKAISFFGILFLLMPGMLISLSQKYQNELTWGIGYIPVYLSYYGASLLIASLLALVLKRVSGRTMPGYTAGLLLGAFFCASITFNYINNRIVVDNLNYSFLYSRGLIEEAAKKGLFDSVSNGSLLYINGDHQWDGIYYQSQRQFYGLLAPRKFTDVIRMKDVENFTPEKKYKASYYLHYASLSEDSGYAVLGKLKALTAPRDTFSREVFMYVRVPYYKPIDWDWNVFSPKISFLGKWADPGSGCSDFIFYDYQPSIRLIASGIGWRLYKFTPKKSIDTKSLLIYADRQYISMTDDIELNETVDFRERQFFTKGWSSPETSHRWNDGKEAVVAFRLKKDRRISQRNGNYSLILYAGSNGSQRVTVFINDIHVGDLSFDGTYEKKRLSFDARILRDKGMNTITLKIPNAHTPGNGDTRTLGLSIVSFAVTEQD
jgi:hypothetical protein